MKTREETGQPIDRLVGAVLEILNDLIDEDYERGDQKMADLILDQQFNPIRDEEDFPSSF